MTPIAGKQKYQGVFSLGEHVPAVHETAWVAPTAAVIGQVEIGAESGVWFHCVLRGDTNTIRIGARSNIQDGTVIHVDPGKGSTVIGDEVTIGHACIIHACTLENQAFVGMGSIILNGCVIEQGGMLAAGALLTPGKRIRRNELWTGVPARLHRTLTDTEIHDHLADTLSYVRKARRFATEMLPVTGR